LYLNNNKLKVIPKEIGELENLEYLVIGKNSLTEIPIEIGQLSSLISLNLVNSGPNITIPESIVDLKSLEYLLIDKSIQLPYSISSIGSRLQIVVK
jgi:leucine-rich repeat protein SHOC2